MKKNRFLLILVFSLWQIASRAEESFDTKRSQLVQDARNALEEIRITGAINALPIFEQKLHGIYELGMCTKKTANGLIRSSRTNWVEIVAPIALLKLEALPIIDALRDKTYDVKKPPEIYINSGFIRSDLPPEILNMHKQKDLENRQRREKYNRERALQEAFDDCFQTVRDHVAGAWRISMQQNDPVQFDDWTNRVAVIIKNVDLREQILAPLRKEMEEKTPYKNGSHIH